MGIEFTDSNAYMSLDTWVMANVLVLATHSFCTRFLDRTIDPQHRLFDQMLMAARSVPANIAEGAGRHATSMATEMMLTDVGRSSGIELMGDLELYISLHDAEVWSKHSEIYKRFYCLQPDKANYSDDLLHDVNEHIKAQRKKFAPFLENDDPIICANALLFLCYRIKAMTKAMLIKQFNDFKKKGGFHENLTKERLGAQREESMAQGAPACPLCGAPMIVKVAQRGSNAGKRFWSCCNYHKTGCKGTRRID